MKPFDLELAKAGHPVQTRDGRKARIICYDRLSEDYHLVGLIKSGYDNPVESMHTFTNDGNASIVGPTDLDLFMATTKKEGWVNIYKKGINPYFHYKTDCIWNSKEDAINNINPTIGTYITTKKIEWEE